MTTKEINCYVEYDGTFPTKAHKEDAGFDLCSREDVTIWPKQSKVLDTGVHIQLPYGTCGLLVSKSGLNVNHGITSTGLIDCGYTGPIKVKLYNNSWHKYHIYKGDKITQLVVLPIITADTNFVDELCKTERGNNGFGSTGR